MGSYMTTASGIQFDLEFPTREMIELEDIAHHLSMLCHFNGAVRRFFSIAQHSLLVSVVAPPHLRKWGLMHDAAEAYLGDVTRPLKHLICRDNKDSPTNYKNIEMHVLRLIADVYELEWPVPPELKEYDDQVLKLESTMLMHPTTQLHDGAGNDVDIKAIGGQIPPAYIVPMLPEIAELAFMSRYRKLFMDEDGL